MWHMKNDPYRRTNGCPHCMLLSQGQHASHEATMLSVHRCSHSTCNGLVHSNDFSIQILWRSRRVQAQLNVTNAASTCTQTLKPQKMETSSLHEVLVFVKTRPAASMIDTCIGKLACILKRLMCNAHGCHLSLVGIDWAPFHDLHDSLAY